MTTPYTVFVNSTDAFSDTWQPFFTLLARYWPTLDRPVVLNTDTLDFRHPEVDVQATRAAAAAGRRMTWSELTAAGLDAVDTDLVLYFQDDYFLNAPVRSDVLEQLVDRMATGRYGCLRVLETSISGPWEPTDDELLWEVPRRSDYRINLQAALWRKDLLRSLLRRHETAWEFEVLGSKRAKRITDRIVCVDRDLLSGPGREVIPYVPTGIVKGRWLREAVVPLFADEGIEVDLSVRGFHDQDEYERSKRQGRLERVVHVARRIVPRLRSLR